MKPSRKFLPLACFSFCLGVSQFVASGHAGDIASASPSGQNPVRVIGGVAMVPAKHAAGSASSNSSSATASEYSTEELDRMLMPDSDKEKKPFMQIRILQALQSQTAKGSTHALRAQRSLLGLMNENFKTANPATWNDQRNMRSVVLLLLSGGHPSVGHHLLALNPPPQADMTMVQGALDYIEGRKDDAFAKLTPIEPLNLEPSLGGQMALVQAVLFLPHDLKSALAAIDKARLLMPGSLIEEAALRRGVSITAALDEPDLFQTYALQYIRHYRSSIYKEDFRRRFGLAMRHFSDNRSQEAFDYLDGAITEFYIDTRREFYLLLSYASLVQGNLDLAQKAAHSALPLSVINTQDRSRARLYIAGSMIKADTLDTALDHLWAVKRNSLNQRDQHLAERVSQTLNSIRHWPESDQRSQSFISKEALEKPEGEDWDNGSISNARQELEASDLLLTFSDKPLKEVSK